MENLQNFMIIGMQILFFGGLIVMFGMIVVAILQEHGRDALRGKTDWKKMLNTMSGITLTLAIIIVAVPLTFYVIYEAFNASLPYVSKMQVLVVDNVTGILNGGGVVYNDTTTSVSQPNYMGSPPQAPTPTPIMQGGGIYGQDDAVGGGGEVIIVYPTAIPQPTVIPNVIQPTPTEDLGWILP